MAGTLCSLAALRTPQGASGSRRARQRSASAPAGRPPPGALQLCSGAAGVEHRVHKGRPAASQRQLRHHHGDHGSAARTFRAALPLCDHVRTRINGWTVGLRQSVGSMTPTPVRLARRTPAGQRHSVPASSDQRASLSRPGRKVATRVLAQSASASPAALRAHALTLIKAVRRVAP